MKGVVLVTRRLLDGPMATLAAAPEIAELRVNPHDRPMARDELLAAVRGCDALLAQLVDRVDAELLDAAPSLRVVANHAVGYDNVDVPAATARGVAVTNTPDVLTESTADLTLALILAVARRVVEADRFLRAGRWTEWSPGLLLGADVHGKTLGIVGLGRIGAAVARRARAFGMRLLWSGPHDKPEATELGAERLELDELLARSDFVTLHSYLDATTHHLLDRRRLALMRPHAFLINASRGPLVDEAALVEALRAGRIAGAGLDVYEREPELTPGLIELDNVVLLPHVGSATRETRTAMGEIAVANVLDALRGRTPRTCVNPVAISRPSPSAGQ